MQGLMIWLRPAWPSLRLWCITFGVLVSQLNNTPKPKRSGLRCTMYFLYTWCTRECCNSLGRTPICRDSRVNHMFRNTCDNWIITLSLGDQGNHSLTDTADVRTVTTHTVSSRIRERLDKLGRRHCCGGSSSVCISKNMLLYTKMAVANWSYCHSLGLVDAGSISSEVSSNWDLCTDAGKHYWNFLQSYPSGFTFDYCI